MTGPGIGAIVRLTPVDDLNGHEETLALIVRDGERFPHVEPLARILEPEKVPSYHCGGRFKYLGNRGWYITHDFAVFEVPIDDVPDHVLAEAMRCTLDPDYLPGEELCK